MSLRSGSDELSGESGEGVGGWVLGVVGVVGVRCGVGAPKGRRQLACLTTVLTYIIIRILLTALKNLSQRERV